MKLLLLQESEDEFMLPISSKIGWAFALGISYPSSEVDGDVNTLRAFVSAVFGNLRKAERNVEISLQPVAREGDENLSLRINVTGKVFQVIQDVLYDEDTSKTFKLKLKIETKLFNTERQFAPMSFLLTPDSVQGSLPTLTSYTVVASRHGLPVCRNGQRQLQRPAICRMQLELEADSYINMTGALSSLQAKNKKIFDEQQFCDFEIVSEEGNVFPCHKIFLSSASPVLASTISDQFREGREGRLETQDISDPSIKALLEFIYYNSIKAPQLDSLISWELLKASDFYNIPSLWTAMSRIILAKESKWFNLDDALQIFDYVSKKTDGSGILELKRKLTKVLAVKIEQLDGSELFKKMFPTDNSRDMFKSSLEGSK